MYGLGTGYLCCVFSALHTVGRRFYWIDPLTYAQQALAVNEFGAQRWQVQSTPSGQSVGDSVLLARGAHLSDWWIWLGVGVMIFAWAVFNIATWLFHAYLDRTPHTLVLQLAKLCMTLGPLAYHC